MTQKQTYKGVPLRVPIGEVSIVEIQQPELRIRIFGPDRKGAAKVAYRVRAGGATRTGYTDGDGWVIEKNLDAIEVVVEWATDEELARNAGDYTYRLRLDVSTEEGDAGARRRLANLGFAPDVALAGAVRGFQLAYGLPATGELDTATQARLTSVHDGQLAGGS